MKILYLMIIMLLSTHFAYATPDIAIKLGLLFTSCQPRMAYSDEPEIWQVLMAEAVSEGEVGMMAVACVIRNRNNNLRGFYGAKRKDLDAFCNRQGQYYIHLAKEIERKIFEESYADITFGATHFENLAYGEPYWTKGMQITCKIGKHTFYK